MDSSYCRSTSRALPTARAGLRSGQKVTSVLLAEDDDFLWHLDVCRLQQFGQLLGAGANPDALKRRKFCDSRSTLSFMNLVPLNSGMLWRTRS
jgi:hypothetical protein